MSRDTAIRSSIVAALCSLTLVSISVTASARGRKSNPPPPPPPPPVECAAAGVSQPAYAIFLDGYPGRFQLVNLPCLDSQPAEAAVPRELALDLGRKGRRFEMANGDVFFDGTRYRFVFGGRTSSSEHWGIWGGTIDVAGGIIRDIHRIVTTDGVREEDPRFSWDGQTIIYKSAGEVMSIGTGAAWGQGYTLPLLLRAEPGCELWAPSMYTVGLFSYVRRCNDDATSDRIAIESGGTRTLLESVGGGVDRFAHFTPDGNLVYSHVDSATGRASLWRSNGYSAPELLLDATPSDDDAYADRQFDYIAFSGWNDATDHYDMYVTRYYDSVPTAIRITAGIQVLGTVTFGYSETVASP